MAFYIYEHVYTYTAAAVYTGYEQMSVGNATAIYTRIS